MLFRYLAALAVLAAMASPVLADQKCFVAPGSTVSGPITHYTDGDTFDIGRDRIRPWGINATEQGQFGYNEAAVASRRTCVPLD